MSQIVYAKKAPPLWKKVTEDLSSQLDSYKFGERFVTSHEICRRYKVSQITALRALAELEKDGLVKRQRRKGTIVNAVGRKLTFRLVIPESLNRERVLTGHIYLRLHQGILAEAHDLGVEVETAFENYLPTMCRQSGPDAGYLILQELAPATARLLKSKRAACVNVHPATEEAGFPSVRVDARHGAFLAVEHLASLGHKRIGFICGPLARLTFLARWEGYREALQAHHIPYDPELIRETSGERAREDEAAFRELLSVSPAPTALFTANDCRAIHVLEVCRRKKLRVPKDISVVGYDNIPEAAMFNPSLTSVDTNLREVGARAVRALAAMIMTGRQEKEIMLKPKLILRESTGPAPA